MTQELSSDDCTELAKFLERSARARSEARRALCEIIGIEASNLNFLDGTSDRDFSIELVTHLNRTENFQALSRLCDEIRENLYGQQLERIEHIVTKISGNNQNVTFTSEANFVQDFSRNWPQLENFANPRIRILEAEIRTNSRYWKEISQGEPALNNSCTAEYFSRVVSKITNLRKIFQEPEKLGKQKFISDLPATLLQINNLLSDMSHLFSIDQDSKRNTDIRRLIDLVFKNLKVIESKAVEAKYEMITSTLSEGKWKYLTFLTQKIDISLSKMCLLFEEIKAEAIRASSPS